MRKLRGEEATVQATPLPRTITQGAAGPPPAPLPVSRSLRQKLAGGVRPVRASSCPRGGARQGLRGSSPFILPLLLPTHSPHPA